MARKADSADAGSDAASAPRETLTGTLDRIHYHNDGFLIARVRFSQEEKARCGLERAETSVKGTMLSPQLGLEYEFTGQWVEHEKFGRQFSFTEYAAHLPVSRWAVQRYLDENARWVGPVIADALIKAYGERALEVCKDEPERVAAEINGISPERAAEMSETLKRGAQSERVVLELKTIFEGVPRVTKRILDRIVAAYKHEAPAVVRANPYKLVDDIEGVGFDTADRIGRKVGFKRVGFPRLRAGLKHVLEEAAFGDGNVCLPESSFRAQARGLLDVPRSLVEESLQRCVSRGEIVVEEGFPAKGTFVYSQKLFTAEESIALRTAALLKAFAEKAEPRGFEHGADPQSEDNSPLPPADPDHHFCETCGLPDEEIFRQLADDQSEALFSAIRSGVFVLTGGPGTGKTHTIKALMRLLELEGVVRDSAADDEEEEQHADDNAPEHLSDCGHDGECEEGCPVDAAVQLERDAASSADAPAEGKVTAPAPSPPRFERVPPRILLCAPTGKAAKRMYEQTGKRAHTIHKLLQPTATVEGDFIFAHGAGNPLEADVVIVDETSMVDVQLAASLFEAVPLGARLILIGDTDQLPSVGPGNVLRDIIASKVVPCARLETIKRQDAGEIVRALAEIRAGQVPEWRGEDETSEGSDLYFIEHHSEKDIQIEIENIVGNAQHPLGGQIDPMRDIQVIAPLRTKTSLSCASLNELFQRTLNAENPPLEGHNKKPLRFRVGDKVMQMKNAYARDLINGDVGYIRAIDMKTRQMTVDFEEPKRSVKIGVYDNDLELAYACTVHKYQGSEARVIVIPVHRSFGSLIMQRPLLYTAISRARELCILVGQTKEAAATIGRNTPRTRWSMLKQRLREAVSGTEEALAADEAVRAAQVLDAADADDEGESEGEDPGETTAAS